MFRTFTLSIFACALLLLATSHAWRTIHPREAPAVTPLVQLEEMGDLVSLRVRYADVKPFVASSTTHMLFGEVELGRTEVLLIAKGECTLATNLRAAKLAQEEGGQAQLKLILPAPRILNASINHGLSRVWSGSTHRLDSFVGPNDNMRRAIDAAYAEAEADIRRTCRSPAYLTEAKKNAETVLRGLFARSGQQLVVEWAAT